MDQARRRVAIGVFATIGEMEVVAGRLKVLGITHFELLPIHAGQAPQEGAGRSVQNLFQSHDPTSNTVALKIFLQTPDEERIVAGVLLGSAACSVQLHDVDSAA